MEESSASSCRQAGRQAWWRRACLAITLQEEGRQAGGGRRAGNAASMHDAAVHAGDCEAASAAPGRRWAQRDRIWCLPAAGLLRPRPPLPQRPCQTPPPRRCCARSRWRRSGRRWPQPAAGTQDRGAGRRKSGQPAWIQCINAKQCNAGAAGSLRRQERLQGLPKTSKPPFPPFPPTASRPTHLQQVLFCDDHGVVLQGEM
jgi:hypothetical protein